MHSMCISRLIKVIYDVFDYILPVHMGADKSLARPTSRCILFDGENILYLGFRAS